MIATTASNGQAEMTAQFIKILVVEDSPIDFAVAGKWLRAKAYRFEIVHEESIALAVQHVGTERFDAILLDLGLSDCQGIDTFQRMQRSCGNVPIVVLTGLDDEEAGLKAVREGAQDYLIKGQVTACLLVHSIRYAIERNRTKTALHASEAEYRRLFESAKDGILILNPATGQINDANPFLFELLGYTKSEICAKKLWEIGFCRDIDASKKLFERLQHEGHVRYDDLPVETKDGRSVDVEFVSNSYLVGGRERIQCNIRDISERVRVQAVLREVEQTRQQERQRAVDEIQRLNVELEQRVRDRTKQLEAANKEMEAFAYSVSHDLCAPLRAIDGFSQSLIENESGRLSEQGKDDLHRVRAAAQRMGQLIDDLLILSRLSRAELRTGSVDLGALVRAIAGELHKAEPGRRVDIVIPDGLAAWGDAGLLRVVLDNLLRNAWKFTSKHAQAHIEVGTVPSTDGLPTYFVRDDGAGFDMAYMNKLFTPFQRLHAVDEFAGTGIGLATVQRIVYRHGGRVWAEAAVEKGATFYFTLGTAKTCPGNRAA